MNPLPHHRQILSVRGMTCRSCELLIEHRLKRVHGIVEVRVSERRGEVEVFSFGELPPPSLEVLQKALHGTHYVLSSTFLERGPGGPSREADVEDIQGERRDTRHWLELGGMLVLILALWKILRVTGVFNIPVAFESALSYSTVFVVGLVAATSTCLAVVGGLLLSVSAKWCETFQPTNRWEKFQPLLLFNVGRVAGYFLLGGLIGLLGTALTLSPNTTGYLTVGVSLVMVVLGLNILKILPKRYCTLPLPKAMTHRIHDLTESRNPVAPMVLGGLTFFLPCGFTQSMQLLALTSGSFLQGSLIMGVFALGTLPALLGISIVSSIAEGGFLRLFLKFSGTLVVLLGLYNLNNGLLLTGVDAAGFFGRLRSPATYVTGQAGTISENVTIAQDGRQTLTLAASDYGYSPSSSTIEAGRETWVYVPLDRPLYGCASVLTDREHGQTKLLVQGDNWLGPIIPTDDFLLTCSMAMMKTYVYVTGGGGAVAAQPAPVVAAQANIPSNAQVVDLVWTRNGYSPNLVEVRQGAPTVVRVSSTSPTGGCMSTVVFPQFNQSAFVPAPGQPAAQIALATDLAQAGDYPVTCGMGGRMATLRVTAS